MATAAIENTPNKIDGAFNNVLCAGEIAARNIGEIAMIIMDKEAGQ
jgi:hypothetical protein